MRIIEETIIHPLPDERIIEKEERYWHQKLPEDYKKFLMNYGGCEVVENAFDDDRGIDYAIDRFFCVLENPASAGVLGEYDIGVVETEVSERLTDNEDLIGVDVLPIAELFAGDLLCLDFRKTPEAPTVCVWYHEESEDFEPSTYEIAKSFTEFLGMLYGDTEDLEGEAIEDAVDEIKKESVAENAEAINEDTPVEEKRMSLLEKLKSAIKKAFG